MRVGFLMAALLAFACVVHAEDAKAPDKKPEAKEEKKKDAGKKPEAKKGKKAPEFKLLDVDGKERTLKEFKGKVVVLEWCNYFCPFVVLHYKNGNMQSIQKEYTKKGVVWLSIMSTNPKHRDYRDPKTLKALAKERKAVPTAMLMDADGKVGRAYKAKTTPHMFVVNKDGMIAYQGAIDSNPRDIKNAKNYVRETLDALLADKPVPTAKTSAYG